MINVIPFKEEKNYFNLVHKKLSNKYNCTKEFYDSKKIDELIYNDPSKYSSLFKEYLLYEEDTEFLRRYYSSSELPKKLKHILFFYDKYSKVFPNYTIMEGSKYLYKNIQKKQKMIDNLQEIKKQENINKKHVLENNTTILNSTAINSIMNESNSFYKQNLNHLFNFELNTSVDDYNKIIMYIDHAEEIANRNIVMSPRIANTKKNSILMKELNKIHMSNSIEKTTLRKNSKRSKDLFSPQNSHLDLNNISTKSTKTKFVLHKKVNSQNPITNNTLIKKKILEIEKNKINHHMKPLSVNDKMNYYMNYNNSLNIKNISKNYSSHNTIDNYSNNSNILSVTSFRTAINNSINISTTHKKNFSGNSTQIRFMNSNPRTPSCKENFTERNGNKKFSFFNNSMFKSIRKQSSNKNLNVELSPIIQKKNFLSTLNSGFYLGKNKKILYKEPLIKDKFLDNNMGKIKLRMNSNKVK